MADDGPPLVRPVPRRPFSINLMSVTPPDDELSEPIDCAFTSPKPDARFLDAGLAPTEPASPSRPPSVMNLTSPTLLGIYSQAASGPRDRSFADRDDLVDTPWGTGAQTPIKRPGLDDATYELMRDRSHPLRRPSSYRPVDTACPPSTASTLLSLSFRAAVLFLLGIGYGVLVTRIHDEQQYFADLTEGIIKPGANWKYLAFWGASGVVLGSLLPWVDKVWEDSFGGDSAIAGADDDGAGDGSLGPGTDWALVMRAIGAFVGIIFAIRKLAWASTLQVSATLALVNPLLWWLIDRSKPGFLLSAGVGLAGSALLLGVNPDMMPAPSRLSPQSSASAPTAAAAAGNASASSSGAEGVTPPVLAGLASQETVETGIWMLSVLFCSCVCFGNIGRRLAWSKKAGVRGRWGGVR
ncbi:hypothetical protein CDD83_8203 [Cordyceps sp. RAO-2017]|nr:hypothetical protein CDD83_8203 [Cordyceps sp. RAO-2017]